MYGQANSICLALAASAHNATIESVQFKFAEILVQSRSLYAFVPVNCFWPSAHTLCRISFMCESARKMHIDVTAILKLYRLFAWLK